MGTLGHTGTFVTHCGTTPAVLDVLEVEKGSQEFPELQTGRCYTPIWCPLAPAFSNDNTSENVLLSPIFCQDKFQQQHVHVPSSLSSEFRSRMEENKFKPNLQIIYYVPCA